LTTGGIDHATLVKLYGTDPQTATAQQESRIISGRSTS
jgi:hypothetical protein